MSPSSTIHVGQHDTKYVTFELLMHAAFVADEIWGFILEPARTWASPRELRYVGKTLCMPAGLLVTNPSKYRVASCM